MHNMCIRPTAEELENFGTPDFTIYNGGQFPCNQCTHYMTSLTSIDLNLARKEMVILDTQYAGEMKKGLFSVMHYLMPKRGILSLHSGCNMGKGEDVALFFYLSGTGKTTLSTDHNRFLIGDDEHCWSDNGVSNIEGGCYAKCIDLSREKEPDIWNCWRTREVNYSDKSVTDTLCGTPPKECYPFASYPIEYIPNAKIPCVEPHPKNVILLACDAFGVLPPVSKLSLAQTMYHFIIIYIIVLLFCSYGSGNRIKLSYIHSGSLLNANYIKTDVFGLEIPTETEGVPSEILQPMNTNETLLKLAGLFKKNFEVFTNYKIGEDNSLTEEILAVGPNF
ncbi:hypothetical protein AMTRI_Chr13g123650 [Amborella trichopoda]